MTYDTLPRKPYRKYRIVLVSAFHWAFIHWLSLFLILYGLYNVLPFIAPIFMQLGWTGPAQAIYSIYGLFCHQMAQRCFFLFGTKPMYNLNQLPITFMGSMDSDMSALRTFDGKAGFGWKVAWSDRMVYMYGAVWLAGVIYAIKRRRQYIQPLHWLGFVALLLPMAIDGGTHFLSDLMFGLGSGFRYNNAWLAMLTNHALPTWFYIGDAFGSFNAWMRLITGLLFGTAIVWLAFPHLDRQMKDLSNTLAAKLIYAAPTNPM